MSAVARAGRGGFDLPETVADAITGGDRRALARAASWLESDDPRGAEVLAAVRRAGDAGREGGQLVGVTGSPGSGKSTLVDHLIGVERGRGRRVAVVAVDPTSPFTGGALLGDRIRMTRWHDDPGVFVRSMATRGQLGGLALGTLRVAGLLASAGFDLVLIETVGVGQSEVDIVEVADTTVLVLTPGGGDGVQAFKAGVMEIADVFVVNKADLPGAERVRREIRAALALAPASEHAWHAPVLMATARDGGGSEELVHALDTHRTHLAQAGGFELRRRRRIRGELAAAVRKRVRQLVADQEEAWVEAVSAGEVSAERAVAEMVATLGAKARD